MIPFAPTLTRILPVTRTHAVARELTAEDSMFHPLVAALERNTDMQSDAALAFLLVCPQFLDRLLTKASAWPPSETAA